MFAVTVLLFAVVEGLAGELAAGRAAYSYERAAVQITERLHSEYDADLGWVNRPNMFIPDLYGEGAYMRTNAQRLRANREYPAAVPAAKLRIICSGDSFTMGYSVSNDQTWCARLEQRDARLETVNMGEGGYGADQAFLWYRRDGAKLQHDVQIFAVIPPDFKRMQSDDFEGYPKPYLKIVNGVLQAANTPVPRVSTISLRARLHAAALKLHTVELAWAVAMHFGLAAPLTERTVLSEEELKVVAGRMFEELVQLNTARRSTLVIVYLPKPLDSTNGPNGPPDRWRPFVHGTADRLGVPFIDLVEEYRKIPEVEGEAMFVLPFRPSHYNVRGNEWVAATLHDRLMAIPDIAAKIRARVR